MNTPVDLRSLACCFEGIVPSGIATCSADGIPNVTYVSHVHLVDQQHVATSFQFFSKTRHNLMENPYATIRVLDPSNLRPYLLQVRFARSETEGPLFDHMAMKLQVIASYEGMTDIFSLKAADVFEVLEVRTVDDYTSYTVPVSVDRALTDPKALELMRMITEKVVRYGGLEELLDQSLALLDQFLDWTHMMILLPDESGQTLLTHVSHGYPINGVGSEVRIGEGIIGLAAQHRKIMQLSGANLGLRYAKATRAAVSKSEQAAELVRRIPLPGIENPASQLAAPILAFGELLGVFVVESDRKAYWDSGDQNMAAIFVNLLAVSMKALETQTQPASSTGTLLKLETARQSTCSLSSSSSPARVHRLRLARTEECLFLNDAYLIKNLPARILWYLLKIHVESGRREFSNMELRSQPELKLPEFKDNLEARLILLRKRLDNQCPDIRLTSTGRGRFRLELDSRIELTESN